MLERASAHISRPDDLPEELGLTAGGYRLSETQAQAILDLRLQKLTGLEQDRIIREYEELLEKIADLLDVLSRPERLTDVIRAELDEILEQYGDERRTEIIEDQLDLTMEDLITGTGRGGYLLPCGLCENTTAGYLSVTTPWRQGQIGYQYERRRFYR